MPPELPPPSSSGPGGSPPAAPRRRGAPRGNQNAVKHGFYISRSHQGDLQEHEAHEFSGLEDEIVMLRLHIRQLIRSAADVDDFYANLDLLRTLCLATDALTRLIRTQYLLSGSQDGTALAINRALGEVVTEMGFSKSAAPP